MDRRDVLIGASCAIVAAAVPTAAAAALPSQAQSRADRLAAHMAPLGMYPKADEVLDVLRAEYPLPGGYQMFVSTMEAILVCGPTMGFAVLPVHFHEMDFVRAQMDAAVPRLIENENVGA